MAATLLLGFTLTIAMIVGPFLVGVMDDSRQDQEEELSDAVSAANSGFEVGEVRKNESEVKFNLQNSGRTVLENYTVTAYCDSIVQESFSKKLDPLEIKELNITGCDGEIDRISVDSEELPVSVSKNLKEASGDNETINSFYIEDTSQVSFWDRGSTTVLASYSSYMGYGSYTQTVQTASSDLDIVIDSTQELKNATVVAKVPNFPPNTAPGFEDSDWLANHQAFEYRYNMGDICGNFDFMEAELKQVVLKENDEKVDVNKTASFDCTTTKDSEIIPRSTMAAIDLQAGEINWNSTYSSVGGPGKLYSPGKPVINGSNMFFGGKGSNDEGLYSVDKSSGEKNWNLSIGGEFEQDTRPVYSDNRLYMGAGGKIIAVDPGDPKITWEKSIGDSVRKTPEVTGDSVYGLADRFDSDLLYKLNRSNGDEIWNYSDPDSDYLFAYEEDGDRIFASAGITSGQKIIAINSTSGEKLWEKSLNEESRSIVADDQYVYTESNGHVYSIDKSSGNQNWVLDINSTVRGDMNIKGDKLFAGTGDEEEIFAINKSEGTELWNKSVAGLGWVKPAVSDGKVVVPGGKEVIALDSSDGSQLWTVQAKERVNGPMIDQGMVYVGVRGYPV